MRFRDLHPNIRIRFAESFLGNLLGKMIHPFMTIYFADRFGLSMAGLLLMLNVLVGMLAGFYGGPLADRVGSKARHVERGIPAFFRLCGDGVGQLAMVRLGDRNVFDDLLD